MTSKKKPVFNFKLKGLFEQLKKQAGVTSKDIAEALNVSAQTITTISGKLDTVSVIDMALMADVLKVTPVELTKLILELSDVPNMVNHYHEHYLHDS